MQIHASHNLRSWGFDLKHHRWWLQPVSPEIVSWAGPKYLPKIREHTEIWLKQMKQTTRNLAILMTLAVLCNHLWIGFKSPATRHETSWPIYRQCSCWMANWIRLLNLSRLWLLEVEKSLDIWHTLSVPRTGISIWDHLGYRYQLLPVWPPRDRVPYDLNLKQSKQSIYVPHEKQPTDL